MKIKWFKMKIVQKAKDNSPIILLGVLFLTPIFAGGYQIGGTFMGEKRVWRWNIELE